MCFIFQVPKLFGVLILVEWISASDLLRFDIALCNSKCRDLWKEWMKVYNAQFQESLFNQVVEFPFCPKIVLWASCRCFNLERLFHRLTIGTKMVHLFNALSDQIRSRMLESVSGVKHLKTCGAVGGLCDIVSKIKGVENIQCTNTSDELIQRVACVGHRLRKFEMLKSYEVHEQSVVQMVMKCPLLLELRLEGCYFSSGKDLLLSVLVHCPSLRVMVIRGGLNISDRDLMIFALHKKSTMTEFTMVNTVKENKVTRKALESRGLIRRVLAGQAVTVACEDLPKCTPLHCGRELNKNGLICEFLRRNGLDEKLMGRAPSSFGSISGALTHYLELESSAVSSCCDGQYGLDLVSDEEAAVKKEE